MCERFTTLEPRCGGVMYSRSSPTSLGKSEESYLSRLSRHWGTSQPLPAQHRYHAVPNVQTRVVVVVGPNPGQTVHVVLLLHIRLVEAGCHVSEVRNIKVSPMRVFRRLPGSACFFRRLSRSVALLPRWGHEKVEANVWSWSCTTFLDD